MSARRKQLPHGTDYQALEDFKVRLSGAKAPSGEAEQRFQTVAEQRIAIAALFRAGFQMIRIAVILELPPAEVEIDLREYLLEARQ